MSSHLSDVQDVQNVKLLHFDNKGPTRMSPDHQFKLLQLTCLILPEANEGVMTRVACCLVTKWVGRAGKGGGEAASQGGHEER